MQFVKPTPDQVTTMQIFRDKYETLLEDIKSLEMPTTSRGFALAKTKLEESAMWLNKAITKND